MIDNVDTVQSSEELERLVAAASKPYPHPDDKEAYREWIEAHNALDNRCALPLAREVLAQREHAAQAREALEDLPKMHGMEVGEFYLDYQYWFEHRAQPLIDALDAMKGGRDG